MTNVRSLVIASLAFFVLLILSLNYVVAVNLGKTGLLYSDYGKFYQSAQSILSGKSIYAPTYYIKKEDKSNFIPMRAVHRVPGNLNSPIFSLFILPLSFFSYAVSIWMWSILSVLSGLLCVFLLRKKLVDKKNFTPLLTIGLILGFFSYYPNYAVIQFGQNPLVLLPLLVGGWLAARDNKLSVAAVLMGIAASVKPFFGLFGLYFLLRREWRALFLYAGVILVSILLPLIFFGKKVFVDYYGVLHEVKWAATSWNASIWGELVRLFGDHREFNKAIIAIPGLAAKLYLPICGILILAYIKLLLPQSNIQPQQKCDIDFSATIVVMLLLSPLGWIYYFPFLIVPFAALWLLMKNNNYYPVALPILIALLILLTALPAPLIASGYINKENFIAVFFWSSCYTVALCMILGILFFVRRTLPTHDKTIQRAPLSNYLLVLIFGVALLPSFLGVMKTANAITVHGYKAMDSYQIVYSGD